MTTTADHLVDHPDHALMAAALSGAVVVLPADLGGPLYRIDARVPDRITIYLDHALDAVDQRRAWSALDRDLRVLLRRRRRAGLTAVAGVGDPVGPAAARGELAAVTA